MTISPSVKSKKNVYTKASTSGGISLPGRGASSRPVSTIFKTRKSLKVKKTKSNFDQEPSHSQERIIHPSHSTKASGQRKTSRTNNTLRVEMRSSQDVSSHSDGSRVSVGSNHSKRSTTSSLLRIGSKPLRQRKVSRTVDTLNCSIKKQEEEIPNNNDKENILTSTPVEAVGQSLIGVSVVRDTLQKSFREQSETATSTPRVIRQDHSVTEFEWNVSNINQQDLGNTEADLLKVSFASSLLEAKEKTTGHGKVSRTEKILRYSTKQQLPGKISSTEEEDKILTGTMEEILTLDSEPMRAADEVEEVPLETDKEGPMKQKKTEEERTSRESSRSEMDDDGDMEVEPMEDTKESSKLQQESFSTEEEEREVVSEKEKEGPMKPRETVSSPEEESPRSEMADECDMEIEPMEEMEESSKSQQYNFSTDGEETEVLSKKVFSPEEERISWESSRSEMDDDGDMEVEESSKLEQESFSTEKEVTGISSLRMRETERSQWVSSVDAINLSVNRDVFLESVFVFQSFNKDVRNKFKFEIYHTQSGELLHQEIDDILNETDVPQIGELELDNDVKLESGRTYTAVLETRGKESFGGTKGNSISCCPIPHSFTSLIVDYTKPSQDVLESFLTNAENNTSQTVGQLPGFHFKLVEP